MVSEKIRHDYRHDSHQPAARSLKDSLEKAGYQVMEEYLHERNPALLSCKRTPENPEGRPLALVRIENGEKIAKAVLSGREMDASHATKENCRDLCLYLTAKAFQKIDASYERGAIRVTHPHFAKIYEFMSRCRDSYSRPSTHFRGYSLGKQVGIDFEKGDLYDKDLGTVLCAQIRIKVTDKAGKEHQHDSFYLKFEREGTSKSNPLGAVKHLFHWAVHVLSGGGETTIRGRATRRETDKHDTKGVDHVTAAFKNVQKLINKNYKSIFKTDRHTATYLFEMVREVRRIQMKMKTKAFSDSKAKQGKMSPYEKAEKKYKALASTIEEFEKVLPKNAEILGGKEVLLELDL